MAEEKSIPGKRQVLSVKDIPANATLYDFVKLYGIEKKIIDIAIAQTQLPNELREEAAQEIRITWVSIKPRTGQFKPGQVASYAHRIAKHAVLRLRRELGSAVRLPGSAFRKRKDGSSYVTPGVLSVPIEWSELDNWFDVSALDDALTNANEQPVSGDMLDHNAVPEAHEAANASEFGGNVESFHLAEDMVNDIKRMREKKKAAVYDLITPKQRQIFDLLNDNYSFDEIQKELGIRNATIIKEAAIIGKTIEGIFGDEN